LIGDGLIGDGLTGDGLMGVEALLSSSSPSQIVDSEILLKKPRLKVNSMGSSPAA